MLWTLVYREEVRAILIALSDVVAELWEHHIDDTIRNLRELAAGRAEREWRERQSAVDPAGADEARRAS